MLGYLFGLVVAAWLSGSVLVSIDEFTLCPVSTATGDCLQMGKSSRSVTRHSGQHSVLPSEARKISTGQSAVTLCGWGVNAGMVYSNCG